MAAIRHQVLVAVDWDGKGDAQAVIDFLKKHDAYVSAKRTTIAHYATGARIPTWRFVFDGNKVRDTEVHGFGFYVGFVVHIEEEVSA